MIRQFNSDGASATERLGEKIGARLKGGEVIELISDLGGGKTTLTRGLARGAGASERVSSPTFTLSNEYTARGFKIYHFDFYRLTAAGIMSDELAEVIGDKEAVVIIEWGEIVADVLPADRLTVKITATGENARRLEFRYPVGLEYLLDK